MYTNTVIAFSVIISIETLVVCVGNAFVIFVFWTQFTGSRRRASYLLINLAVADFLIGVGEFSLICCTSMAHAGNTKIWAKIISAYAKKCSITGFSSLRGGGGQKTQVYMPSRGMNT